MRAAAACCCALLALPGLAYGRPRPPRGALQLPTHLQASRTLADLPPPRSADDALALHAEVKRRAGRIQQHYGHRTPQPLPLPRVPSPRQGPRVVPSDFGADPTGATDSTAAFAQAMAALLTARGPRHTMADNNTDLGGATLDLSGGTYLISAPLVIPGGNGNLHIVDGTLRASPTFPGDPSPCVWGVERRAEILGLGPVAGCFLALGSGLGLVGTVSSRR